MFDWNHVFHCGDNGSGNVSTMICWKSEACSTHFQPLASLGGFGYLTQKHIDLRKKSWELVFQGRFNKS